MKKLVCYSVSVLLIFLSYIPASQSEEVKLEKVWETEAIYKLPESVIYDEKRDVLYVSNINEHGFKHLGNGFISKVGVDASPSCSRSHRAWDASATQSVSRHIRSTTCRTCAAAVSGGVAISRWMRSDSSRCASRARSA